MLVEISDLVLNFLIGGWLCCLCIFGWVGAFV